MKTVLPQVAGSSVGREARFGPYIGRFRKPLVTYTADLAAIIAEIRVLRQRLDDNRWP